MFDFIGDAWVLLRPRRKAQYLGFAMTVGLFLFIVWIFQGN
jgi:hypothetical protein